MRRLHQQGLRFKNMPQMDKVELSGSSKIRFGSQEDAIERPWFILSSRYGGDTRDPSVEELRSALTEVYVENCSSMTLADYEEHPSASVRYGTDSGPMYVLCVDRSGSATLEQWKDQDFQDELAAPLTIENVTSQEALKMWSKLQSGQIESLRDEFERLGK